MTLLLLLRPSKETIDTPTVTVDTHDLGVDSIKQYHYPYPERTFEVDRGKKALKKRKDSQKLKQSQLNAANASLAQINSEIAQIQATQNNKLTEALRAQEGRLLLQKESLETQKKLLIAQLIDDELILMLLAL